MSTEATQATAPRLGVLLINLGSPDAPTAEALRRYLAEFLGDPCVVDWPRWLWAPILHGIILRTRPARSAALYERVWTPEGAPLLATSLAQARLLETALGPGTLVRAGMRYGSPSLGEAWDALIAAGAERVVALPMFPQHSLATTETARRELQRVRDERASPQACNWIEAYPEHPAYLSALAAGVREHAQRAPPEHYVFSFHGLPARWVRRGSPYRAHCEATARGLAAELQLQASQWSLVFQSRFGPERWLEPYADEFVPALAKRVRKVLVACPGFPADCLETTDEIGRELAEQFLAAGGEEFTLVPCLNEHPAWIQALAQLVRENSP
ncbi:MAG: ferrochelatase [Planctomycetota bacterium]|nr:MAG: ferrochelatase [Planctomycetota bacterium]